MGETTGKRPPRLGWLVSETYAIVKRIERKLGEQEATAVEYTGFEAERALRDLAAQVPDQPYLGLATTEEMMRELICRFKHVSEANINVNIDRALVLAEMLGSMGAPEREYRTVDDG